MHSLLQNTLNVVLILLFCLASQSMDAQQFSNALYFLDNLDVTTFNLTVAHSKVQFLLGTKADTYGINGGNLGPTLIMKAENIVTLNAAINSPYNTFPNPAEDRLEIRMESKRLTEIDQIAVWSLDGKLVKTLTFSKKDTRITFNVSDLSSGIYVLSISGANGSNYALKFQGE